MSDTPTSRSEQLALLQELFASATRDASEAMNRWTNGMVTLTLDEVRELPLEEVCGELNLSNELMTMIVLTLDGEMGGDMILSFDEKNGRALAASLLGREVCTDPEWNELEQSALNETGNILGCAYMNALTRLVEVELVPSPPHFIQDYGASVLQQALMAQAMYCDKALVCQTHFHRAGEEMDWSVFFVPNEKMRQTMEETLQGVS
jgi:chemotaxis protein CheC